MANDALETAIKVLGGPTEASHVLRVSYWTIREWRKAGRVRDSQYAVLLAEAAQAAGAGDITVRALSGLELVNGGNGGGPTRRRFSKEPYLTSRRYSPPSAIPPVGPMARAA